MTYALSLETELLIKSIPIPSSSRMRDLRLWSLTPNGIFTTKSAYARLLQEKIVQPNTWSPESRWIWKLRCPNKIKFFLWLSNHGRLPTKVYLHRLSIINDSNCAICNAPETLQHIFFQCPTVQIFWSQLCLPPAFQNIAIYNGNDWLWKCRNLLIPPLNKLII